MTKNKKQEKPVNLKMPFEEAMKRLSKVDKRKVEKNIKQSKQRKK